jgi:hypothetical protein
MIERMRHARFQGLLLLILAAAILAPARTAAAKDYSAERFDVQLALQPDGSLHLVETVVFRFEGGPFTYVTRELPTRKTDGISVLSAEMDGVALPRGEAPGQVEIGEGREVRVRWHFAPVHDAVHTFTLTYRAAGVAYQEDDRDVLAWTVLPREHAYRIDSATARLRYPSGLTPIGRPEIDARRATIREVSADQDGAAVLAGEIRRNGTFTLTVRFPSATVAAPLPAWQQREMDIGAQAPRWMLIAVLASASALLLLVMTWMHRPRSDEDRTSAEPEPQPPSELPIAIAGALQTHAGAPQLAHAMGTLLDLARRGVVEIEEQPSSGMFRQRAFRLEQHGSPAPLRPHEETVLAVAFEQSGQRVPQTDMAKAASRLTRRWSVCRQAVQDEMLALGLIDPERMAARQRLFRISTALLIVSIAAIAIALLLIRTSGPWPFLVPGALGLVTVAGYVLAQSISPLSDEGLRQSRRWRGFRRHLKSVAAGARPRVTNDFERFIGYAVAFGLGARWAKRLASQPGGSRVPEWFHAAEGSGDSMGAFVAMMSSSASAGSGAVGGGGTGAAAGGGSSGAG